jgi:FdhE protein
VDADALVTIAAVAPAPLLRACADHWRERLPAHWTRGHCPVCAGWPLLAEARGLERARRLRCGRCATDWPIDWLRCPYCGVDDHAQLGGLVAEADGVGAPAAGGTPGDPLRTTTVDTCRACRGYLKTVTTLGATPADDLALLDLATVELDVAALGQGYQRPPGLGAELGAHVRTRRGRLLGGWRGV